MSQNARKKLNEAKYFLSMMEKTKGDEAFFFNLSAFFSAARSVTFFLQKEFNDDPDFLEWYADEREEMKKNPLFKLIRDTRNFVLKESYPEARSLQIVSSDTGSNIEQATIYGGIEIIQEIASRGSEGDVRYYLNLHKVSGIDWNSSVARRPICDLCNDAVEELDDLLDRWQKEFLQANGG